MAKKRILSNVAAKRGTLPPAPRASGSAKGALTKSPSYRTQQAIARFGKSARHPLCLAWLRLREREEVLRDVMKGTQLLDSAKQLKKKAIALYRQRCKEEREKEAIRAAELLRKSNEFLQEVEARYRAVGGKNGLVALCNQWKEFHDSAKLAFDIEQWQAKKTGDTKALRGLERLKENINRPMSNSQKRAFGIQKMLRDKVFTGAWAKDGGAKAYWVSASCGYWPVSEESWQGRFTVMEFRSGLEDMYGPRVAGDKEGKKVRRTLKGLGIQPAEDQRGRKWKPPYPKKQEPKQPRGQPHTKTELVRTGDVDHVQRAALDHRVNTRGYVLKREYGKFKYGNTSYGGLSSWVKSARKDLAAIDREIVKLELLRGGRRGRYVY